MRFWVRFFEALKVMCIQESHLNDYRLTVIQTNPDNIALGFLGDRCTPLKFNMEPENKSLEKEIPNLETIILRFHVKFRGVSISWGVHHKQNRWSSLMDHNISCFSWTGSFPGKVSTKQTIKIHKIPSGELT